MTLFWRQFSALFVKNWIVFYKHPFSSVLRFLIFPIAYGIFLAYSQNFFDRGNNIGLGTAVPIRNIRDQFDDSSVLLWVDNTQGNGIMTPAAIMGRVTQNFTDSQLKAVRQVGSVNDLNNECVSSFNGASSCYAAISFEQIPSLLELAGSEALIYILHLAELNDHIDVVKHDSTPETNILPIQWAIDQAIIELATNKKIPNPQEWPFTWESNQNMRTGLRLSFIKLMNTFLALPFILAYTGITYQLAGAISSERASLLTDHLKAMGLSEIARILSWHTSFSLAYLPAWLTVAALWKYRIFTATNWGLILGVHVLTGVGLASWSFFIAVPFGKSPQLASIVTSGLAISVAVVPVMLNTQSNILAIVLSFVFPSMFYIFALKVICGFELASLSTDILTADPNTGLRLLPMMAAATAGVVIWPILASVLEYLLYGIADASDSLLSFGRRRNVPMPPNIAISLKNIGKTFNTGFLGVSRVTAVENLTIDVPKHGIFVLLGPNGAGKSTILSILGGLTNFSSGSVIFEGGIGRPPHGTIGIVPQKDVLFPDLSCIQNLSVWRAIKASNHIQLQDDLEELLRECDLASKIHANSNTLSGGQKRKLQLAAGLVGGSGVVLIDECTSGVDPLSRRALWKALTAHRSERTIVLTTHFLDEADFLADYIAVLAPPGKLIGQGSPVALKTSYGDGYSVLVAFSSEAAAATHTYSLLKEVRTIAPDAEVTTSHPLSASYALDTQQVSQVAQTLRLIESQGHRFGIASYEIFGTSIEDIFLGLMSEGSDVDRTEPDEKGRLPVMSSPMNLRNGRTQRPWAQAWTIFCKRSLIARRSWLAPILAIALGIVGSWWPLRFIRGDARTCARDILDITAAYPLFPPTTYPADGVPIFPAGATAILGSTDHIRDVYDNQSFVDIIQQEYSTERFVGGVSIDFDTGNSLIPWVVDKEGLAMFNLASNLFLNQAIPSVIGNIAGPKFIITQYQNLPQINPEDLLNLRWVVIFGAVMAVFPAVCALYVSKERRSSVQAMQLSNGLANPIGLWLGHLMFDSILSAVVSAGVTVVFALLTEKIRNLALTWLILFLYGISGTLLAYLFAVIVQSSLLALILAAGYQFVIMLLYLTAYMATLNYSPPNRFSKIMGMTHFLLSFTAPIPSIMRASLLSINQFTLLCDGNDISTGVSLVSMTKYGGPILYLILWALALLLILSQVDSGSPFSQLFKRKVSAATGTVDEKTGFDGNVAAEAAQASTSDNLLRVTSVSKSYSGRMVVDRVSLSVARNSTFSMLGPNGAGKTTTFSIISGKLKPDTGDVFINNMSVIRHTKKARLSLGVCPQFSAIDAQLSVREHLSVYGRLKGLHSDELDDDIASLLTVTELNIYAHRLADKLSGGNKRKLMLAIALIGNPSLLLVDEFSTGIDAKMKRDLWKMLRRVSADKAVLLTTHSMEEASALSTKVGIMARQLLDSLPPIAVGTPKELETRYGTYEVQFSCRTRDDLVRIKALMSLIPGSSLTDDVATRFEVPIGIAENMLSLADLFELLSRQIDLPEFMVVRSTLESAFIKIIRENNLQEEDFGRKKRRYGIC